MGLFSRKTRPHHLWYVLRDGIPQLPGWKPCRTVPPRCETLPGKAYDWNLYVKYVKVVEGPGIEDIFRYISYILKEKSYSVSEVAACARNCSVKLFSSNPVVRGKWPDVGYDSNWDTGKASKTMDAWWCQVSQVPIFDGKSPLSPVKSAFLWVILGFVAPECPMFIAIFGGLAPEEGGTNLSWLRLQQVGRGAKKGELHGELTFDMCHTYSYRYIQTNILFKFVYLITKQMFRFEFPMLFDSRKLNFPALGPI